MIERPEFMKAWSHLCERFGKATDGQQAAAYYEFLNEQLDTDEFLRAARAIWATFRFFPRPADFLLLEVSAQWSIALRAIETYNPPNADWHSWWVQLSPRAVDACKRIGGIVGMRAMSDRGDIPRLKSEFEKAFEQAVTESVLALPAPRSRQLAPA